MIFSFVGNCKSNLPYVTARTYYMYCARPYPMSTLNVPASQLVTQWLFAVGKGERH